MKQPYFIAGLLIIFLALAASGCNRSPQGKQEVDSDPAVARVGDEEISANDLRVYVGDRQMSAAVPVNDEQMRRYLQELVTSRSLAQEARRLKLEDDPEVQLAIEQLLGATLLEKQVVAPVIAREISGQEITEFYEKHREEYARPEQVRLADIFIAVDEVADADLRRQKLKLAERLLQEALKTAGVRNGFAELVREYSDKHPLYPLGDTGFFDNKGNPKGLDPALVEAAFALTQKGRVHEQIITTSSGFHIVMQVSRRPAVERKLDEVAGEIRQRIRRDELDTKRRQYIESIKSGTSVKIDDKQIKELTAEYGRTAEPRVAKGTKTAASSSSGQINRPPGLQDTGKQ
ncbi:MAG: peptidyl-prolyl cis-trans isomerase [Desulfofustis sp.]|nr:peptidyl-prolyl cis-trans isomerase [Desulfofustis sp.]